MYNQYYHYHYHPFPYYPSYEYQNTSTFNLPPLGSDSNQPPFPFSLSSSPHKSDTINYVKNTFLDPAAMLHQPPYAQLKQSFMTLLSPPSTTMDQNTQENKEKRQQWMEKKQSARKHEGDDGLVHNIEQHALDGKLSSKLVSSRKIIEEEDEEEEGEEEEEEQEEEEDEEEEEGEEEEEEEEGDEYEYEYEEEEEEEEEYQDQEEQLDVEEIEKVGEEEEREVEEIEDENEYGEYGNDIENDGEEGDYRSENGDEGKAGSDKGNLHRTEIQKEIAEEPLHNLKVVEEPSKEVDKAAEDLINIATACKFGREFENDIKDMLHMIRGM